MAKVKYIPFLLFIILLPLSSCDINSADSERTVDKELDSKASIQYFVKTSDSKLFISYQSDDGLKSQSFDGDLPDNTFIKLIDLNYGTDAYLSVDLKDSNDDNFCEIYLYIINTDDNEVLASRRFRGNEAASGKILANITD